MSSVTKTENKNVAEIVADRIARIRKNPTRFGAVHQFAIYQALFRAYAETGSIVNAAKLAGVSKDTATKYIVEGTEAYPAIRDRIAEVNARVVEQEELALTHRRRQVNETVMGLLKKGAEALGRIELIPKGSYIMDENGEHVRDKDGRPLIAIDESSYKTLASALKELSDIGVPPVQRQAAQTQGDQQGGNTVQVAVNILDRDAAKQGAALVARTITPVGGKPLTPEDEAKLRVRLAKEAVKRVAVYDSSQ